MVQINKQNRNRPIETEEKLMVFREEEFEGLDEIDEKD